MSNVDTFDSQEIDQALSRFEASVDVSDPVQLAMLEEMREHTRRLHQVRGDWNKPSNFRNWNDTKPQTEVKPPLAIESYRYDFLLLFALKSPSTWECICENGQWWMCMQRIQTVREKGK